MNLTLSSHFYIIAVPWILNGHMFFKKDITYIALVKLHTGVIYLHSLQWFSRVMSDGLSMKRHQKAAHSFITVHVGKKWSSIAIAAIVLCTTMLTPVIAIPFCTFIQFWYLMAFFGKMSCVIDMYYILQVSHFLWMKKRNASGQKQYTVSLTPRDSRIE